jgi:uncharacterized protein
MNFRKFLIYSLLLFTFSAQAGQIRVLILTGHTDKYHNWQIKSKNYSTLLASYSYFNVDELVLNDTNAYNLPTSVKLSNYKVIILNINDVQWSELSMQTFESYIRAGGGLVIIHEADNAFPEWLAYNEMIGLGGWGGRNEKSGPYFYYKEGKFTIDNAPGAGGSHGKRVPFVVNVRNSNHPIMKGLPLNWLHINDELYSNLRGPAKNMSVLATAFSDKETGGSGKEEPVLFTLKYGKGRIFHSVLGHTTDKLNESFQNLGFQITFLRGTEWAATGKVKQKLPELLPIENKAVLQNID